ncbi:MAG: dTDP-4-dehydrorhamnose 3,5-epimerase [Gemmatimonadales bacterium]|nr:dTDP-4-dehydrorhamnose 3,5-epimerase [Gemmatimonadales bacterium]
MRVTPADIPDVLLVEPAVHGDERGFFVEAWHSGRYAKAGIAGPFVQDNHSRSLRSTLRGLHYQLERPQGKLIRVTSGEIFDVAVDLRRSSPTFGRSVARVLSEANHWQLWVPPGFAHGFYVLSESADVLYKCTDFHIGQDDRTLRWDDPTLAIPWPVPAGVRPILSARDAAAPPLDDAPTYP